MKGPSSPAGGEGRGGGRGRVYLSSTVEVGQSFSSQGDARIAVERELASNGRSIRHGKKSGSRQNDLRCKTCESWFVKACNKQSTKDWKITKACKHHTNCVGRGRTSSASIEGDVDQVVRANPTIAGTAMKRTLKTAGLDISVRTAQRSKGDRDR